jgi:hypothetical protein
MRSLRRLFFALLTVVALAGAFAGSASAGTATTECTLQAKNSPTHVGEDATFRFFAASRFPAEDIPPSPSGLVTFFDGLPIEGHILGVAVLTPNFVKDNNAVEFSTGALEEGTHTVTAVLFPALPTACPTAFASATHVVLPPPAKPSTTAVSSSANPSKYKQNVTLSAHVTRDGGGAVAGSVQFKADGNNLGGAQTVDGSGNASVDTSDLSVGNHPVSATFTSTNSDTLDGTGSLAGGQTVQAASTTTGVSSSQNPSQSGQAVTLTATVAAVSPGGGTPSGSVQFKDNGNNLGGPATLDGAGKASVTTSSLTIGDHTIQAVYTPADGNYSGSDGSMTQKVEKAKTTLTYNGATNGDFHDQATLSAVLKRQYDDSPVANKPVHFTMASESCDGTTDSSGVASCTIIPQEQAGDYTATASFAGDAGFQSSSDSKTFTVTREQTSLTYTGDTVIQNGGTAHASALLKEDDNAPAISGRSVKFTLGSGATAQTCTGLTDSTGKASCDISPVNQPLGSGTIKADFAQDAYYLGSSTSAQTILYAFPSKGAFAIGDRNAAIGSTATYFSSGWATANSLSGGTAPDAFKGFAPSPGKPPGCGGSFTADPGNSGAPPASVPTYMGTLVTSRVVKSGSNITGNVVQIVVLKTGSYGSSPGQGGKGTVVAVACRA